MSDQMSVRMPQCRPGAWVGGVPVLLLALLALAGAGVDAHAQQTQQTGTVTGIVSDARSRGPIAETQISAVGTGIGTLSGSSGRFVILNLPAGSHQIRAERIGYGTVTQAVTILGGQSVELNFSLVEQPLLLDAIVVTGEAGGARRREIGNTISQVEVGEVNEPTVGLESMLQGRSVGMNITESGGSMGSGSKIRLRGSQSVAMSNQPLVYVDGVRMRSDPYPRNSPPIGNANRSVNVNASPIDNLDPNDIERIEIIKGAAATALYGTEAAAGVIQVFTKRGKSGEAAWQLQIDRGFAHLLPIGPSWDPYMKLDPWLRGAPSFLAGGVKDNVESRFDAPGGFCSNGAPQCRDMYKYETALRQRYYLSVRGGVGQGVGAMDYFVAGSLEDNLGIMQNEGEEKYHFRGNFGFSPISNLQIQWNTALSRSDISNIAGGNNAEGITLQTYRGEVNYVGGYKYDLVNKILDFSINTKIDHLVTGATATYSPSASFNNRLTVGWDRSALELRQLRPYGFVGYDGGVLSNQQWVDHTLTVDLASSYLFDLSDRFRLTTAFGGQTADKTTNEVQGGAADFAGPGNPTLTSGGRTVANENRIRVVNAGVFGQARLDWRNVVFLTLGLRLDGNSAFGEHLDLQPYPKASISWIPSDESFWNPSLGTVKLRAAVGEAGRAPGAFDAIRTWRPVRYGSTPGFLPLNLGNPDLGPERTREYEVGFDASVLDGRLTTEFTYYHTTTRDALFQVQITPSEGNWSSQLENTGKIRNTGIELSANATVIETPNVTWDLGVSLFTNSNEVLSLGGAVPFGTGAQTQIMEGEPVPVIMGKILLNPNELAEPRFKTCIDPITGAQTDVCPMGRNSPSTTITPRTILTLPGGIVLSARGEYLRGFYMENSAWALALERNAQYPGCGDMPQRILAGDIADIPAKYRARCSFGRTSNQRRGLFNFRADFFKLRDVTLELPVSRFVPWGENSTLTFSARNWVRWFNDDWLTLDPEQAANGGFNTLNHGVGETIPPPAIFTMSFRVGF